ncbi:hypothetical protein M2444_003526 [Paenibacillus sp. PastF-3]|nr:hypothetical protein [Paenibacillus sp. PastF-3]
MIFRKNAMVKYTKDGLSFILGGYKSGRNNRKTAIFSYW